MEKMKTVRKTIAIHAPRESVWTVLFDDRFTPIWYGFFSRGSHPETDWRLGSKAIFRDGSNTGLIGRIVDKKPNERLSIEYEGIVTGGVEDYESAHAQDVQGAQEIYKLTEKDGVTSLSIECDMGEEYASLMGRCWDRALAKIRELSLRAYRA